MVSLHQARQKIHPLAAGAEGEAAHMMVDQEAASWARTGGTKTFKGFPLVIYLCHLDPLSRIFHSLLHCPSSEIMDLGETLYPNLEQA